MKKFMLICIAFALFAPQQLSAQCGDDVVVAYRDGLGNYLCYVGTYKLCCDGGFTVTGFQETTKIKVNWSNQVCDVYANGAGDCNNSFSFPTGTITPGSNFWLEFQSGDFGNDGCGMSTGIVFNIGVELGNMNCPGTLIGNDNATTSMMIGDNTTTLSATDIKLYPNPASSFVNISNPDAKNLMIEIFDVRGQRLLSQAANQVREEIDINELANGMYLVKIHDAETLEYISSEKLFVTQ